MAASPTCIGRITILLVVSAWLTGCGAVVTYPDVQRTAQAGGCWPNRPAYPTPPPVTITPPVPLTPTPVGFRWPTGVPSPTRLPTTTPYPRCPPAPGEVLAPWPTPVPPPPPYPTMADTRAGGSSGQKNTLQLPEVVLNIDVAAHPTEDWAAVAAAVWSGNDNPERAYVSVLNPTTRTWTPAHQVDIGAAGLGRYTRTVQVAIAGDGTVFALWGMSDPDFRDNDPPARVWVAESHDHGMSWGPPRPIGDDCRQVIDAAATLDGWLVVGLGCHDGPNRVQPAIALRSPDGAWSLERLPGVIWYFTEGAIALADDGGATRATVAFLTGPNGAMAVPPRALLFATTLGAGAPWQLAARDLDIPGFEEGPRLWHARAVVYRPAGATADSITLLFSDASRWSGYALTSQDGGQSWLAPELVVAPLASAERIAFTAPAYDPVGNRLVAIYTCCIEGGWNNQEPNTHFLRWSTPESGRWEDATPGQRVPLILGARAASNTVTAQSKNARTAWVAWIEGGNAVEVRSFDLTTVLPRAGR
ncbi:MAG: exo-alpha-sialidase [Chloroflexales bacterium]|nr:exo-alpha-sialidase [Chloroflexales bacterium]